MNVLVQILALLGILALAMFTPGMRPVWLIPGYGILALAAMLGGSLKRRPDLSVRAAPCLAATGIFFGWILLRNIFSPAAYVARADLFMVLAGLIVYLIAALCATTPTSRAVITSVLLLLACAQVFVGAMQFTRGNDFMPFDVLPRGAYMARASGFYSCPNHLAGFLEIVLPMALGLIFWSRWRLAGKILAGFVAVVCVAGLMMSASRGGYVSAAAGLFAFAMLSLWLARHWLRRDVWWGTIIMLVLAAIGGSWVALSAVRSSDMLTHRVQAAGIDVPVRLGLWRAAIKQFQLSPIIGTGSGTYTYYGRQFRDDTVQGDPLFAHNDYLHLLAEYGLIGVAGFALFLAVHLRSSWKFLADVLAGRTVDAEREEPGFHGDNSVALTVGALSGIVAIAFHSISDFNLHIPANTLVMAFLFGSLANPFGVLIPEAKAGLERTRAFLRRVPLALPALGLWLAAAALPRWPAENFADKAKVLLSDFRSWDDPGIARQAGEFAALAIERDPKNPDNYLSLGDSAVALAEMAEGPAARDEPYRQAIDAYSRGLRVVPQDVHLVMALAGVYDALGRYEEAASMHRRALELDPNNWEVQWRYGTHLDLLAKHDEADVHFEKAFHLNCNNATYIATHRPKAAPAPPPVQP